MWNIKRLKIYIVTLFAAVCSVGCSDFFDNELTNVIKVDGHLISTDRDAFYQICGILQEMQQIGDGYVVCGELRGDLLSQTRNSSQELRDIEFFDADTTNRYLNERKYYALINHCNYYIDRIDRNAFAEKSDTLIGQVKCIRAWAYLQLALDYGRVHYFTQPVLNVSDQVEVTDYHVPDEILTTADNAMLPSQLIQTLITDLEPYCPADGTKEAFPFISGEYSTINSYPTSYLFIPIRFMLGELYMWQEDFEKAARMYHQLILDRSLIVDGRYRNRWRNAECEDVSTRDWSGQFSTLSTNNQVSVIAFSTEFEQSKTQLPDLFSRDYQLCASTACRELFETQQYTEKLETVSIPGDLRGEGKTSDYGCYVMTIPSDDEMLEEKTDAYVTKFEKMKFSDSYYFSLCRSALVYLRYAEAVNRLGKHELALAVLKYGLNATNLRNNNYIDRRELNGESYTDFGQITQRYESVFSSNTGLHSRGCGDADLNLAYAIDVSAGVDSLTDVENKIMDEYVLECAFEGNRFHDLMRIAQYRRSASYLAIKVASKLSLVDGSPRSREGWIDYLSERRNWYLPSCGR